MAWLATNTIAMLLVAMITRTQSAELCSTLLGYDFFIHDVMENTAVGTVLGQVDITGTDEEIILQQKRHDYYTFNSTTREVTLTKELDTDLGVPEIPVLLIECTKINETTNTGAVDINVWVLLTDWNDNPPVFDNVIHTISIPEDSLVGTTVYSAMSAVDNDKPFDGNSRVLYKIVPGGEFSQYFEIEVPTVPSIQLKKTLDYESVTQMEVLVEAKDSPGRGRGPERSATATLIVTIRDADDLNPVFSSKTYRGTISQGAKLGTVVVTSPAVEAYDPDTMNVPVTYKLLDPYDFFTIDPVTAEISNIKVFDVDVPTLTVVVLASQVDNPNREWFAMLTISISEDNIHAPSFTKPLYTVTRTELEPVDSVLLTVTAKDPDFKTVTGTFLVYDFTEKQDDLEIDDGGNIILKSPLDYEREQDKVVKVTASDGSHTATATVNIQVLDVNDNNPQFVQPVEDTFTAELKENFFITRFQATDADVNNVLTYDLWNNRNLFSLDPQTGELRVQNINRFSSHDRYFLHIVVNDNGIPPRSVSRSIEVIFPELTTQAPPTGQTKPPRPTNATPTRRPDVSTVAVAAASVAPSDNMLVIILGAVAGMLLVVILILIVYMCWRHKRTKEELDRARAPRGQSAKGLTYRQAEAPDDLPKMDLRFTNDLDAAISEYDDVGATTVQQNPLRKQGVNEGYMQSSGSEMDRDVSEIEIETAVVPYDDDFGYPSGRPDFDGQFRTFRGDDTTSNESNHSDSTGGSQRVLVNANKTDGSKMTSWDSDDKIHPQGAQKLLDSKENTASRTKKERPEITVYF